MVTLGNGDIVLGGYASARNGQRSISFVARSSDGGRTWSAPVIIANGHCEPALSDAGDGRMLAILRGEDQGTEGLWHSESPDAGMSWSKPGKIASEQEAPGEVIQLQDGRYLLTFGKRVSQFTDAALRPLVEDQRETYPAYGIYALVSKDGTEWKAEDRRQLMGGTSAGSCGYPSSIQLDDGTIVTVYYAGDIIAEHTIGFHCAAVHYSPEDL